MDTKQLLTILYTIADNVKAKDLTVVNFKGTSAYTDYLLLCHSQSKAHSKGISDNLEMTLKKEHQIRPLGIEGHGESEWIIVDYNDVVVHIFTEYGREFYNLEHLFEDYIEPFTPEGHSV